jgi:peptidoglycan/LPS O-acetylase OafA/YrhL
LADEGKTYIRSDFRFDAPLLGCAIALGEHHWARAFRWFSASSVRRDIVFVSGTAILLGWFALHAQGHGLGGVDSTLVALLGGVLLCSQIGVAAPGVTTRFLATPPMVYVGRISYGVYLWQQLFLGPRIPGLGIVRQFPVLGLALTFVVAVLSYILLEKPLLIIKNARFRKP